MDDEDLASWLYDTSDKRQHIVVPAAKLQKSRIFVTWLEVESF